MVNYLMFNLHLHIGSEKSKTTESIGYKLECNM